MKSILLLLLLTSCAFKAEDQLIPESHTLNLTADWMSEGQTHSDAKLKAVRTLTQSGIIFTASAPITLPANVPPTLQLVIEVPNSAVPSALKSIRTTLIVTGENDHTTELPAQIVGVEKADFKSRISLQVTGLNTAFQANTSEHGIVHLELFSDSQKAVVLEASVRTPPAAVSAAVQGIREWNAATDTARKNKFSKIVIGSKHLNLLEVIRIKNTESLPVELQTPRRPGSRLTQLTTLTNYRDIPCGLSKDENSHDEILTTDMILLPLDSRILKEARAALENIQLKGLISSTLPSGSELSFGLYMQGDGADHWLSRGPLGNELKTIKLPSSCYEICVREDCIMDVPSRVQIERPRFCTCVRKETRRTEVPVIVGVTRGPVVFKTGEDGVRGTLRYGDLDSHEDGESRRLVFLQDINQI